MGVGDPPLVVSYPLPGRLPAGNYYLVADGILYAEPRVRFEVLLRRVPSGEDIPIVTFEHKYPAGKYAQWEDTKAAPAIDARPGDLLVLRVTAVGDDPDSRYVPFSEHAPTPTARFLTLDIP